MLILPTLPYLTPPSGGTPSDINITYIPLKSKFSGLQFCRTRYGSIFIYLAVVVSQKREIRRNSDKIWPTAVQGHPRSSISVSVSGKSICDFLLVINCNYLVHSYLLPFLRYSCLNIENCWFYPRLRPRSGNPLECRDEIRHQNTRIMVKKSRRYSFWHNTGSWQTDGQTRYDRYYLR